jgi:6-phosphogluconolactonase
MADATSPANAPRSSTGIFWVYSGNYGETQPKGIFLHRFDSTAGTLGPAAHAVPAEAPNFVIVHPSGKFLYGVTLAKLAGYAGTVEGFAIDAKNGHLAPINRQPSGGDNPAHLAIDPTGKVLIVANYSGGTVAAFPLSPTGEIAPASAVVQHKGSSIHPRRQTGPNPHGVTFDSTGRVILVPDLGSDKLFNYQVDPATGALTRCAVPGDAATLTPGSGPRHVVFSPGGRFLYVLNELTCTITVFSYQSPGITREIQTLTPWPVVARATAGEIEMHPSGRFVYASNRGHDSIAVCAIDSATGQLTLIQTVATGGKTPRHFALDPTGKFMLASNQDSNRIEIFRVDSGTGKLSASGQGVDSDAPVCVAFVPAT